MQKDFSIIVCTYNGEEHLGNCLDAILNLEKLHDYVDRVIVVDNNSTDKTKSIIQSYEEKDSIFVYDFEPIQGLSYARRHAVGIGTKWVIYIDDDNVLKRNWLIELKKVCDQNDNIGVINGAVIADPERPLSEDESIRLKLMYRNLACTHLEEPTSTDPVNTTPMGAGMCILSSAIRKINEVGWLSLSGRTGDNLASGEDTELCDKVFQMGYKYICNYNMQMYHLISRKRLTAEYTDRLLTGLVKSRYQLISQRRFYILQRLIRLFKYELERIKSKKSNGKLTKEKIEIYRQKELIAKTFIQCVYEDRLYRRR